MTILRQFLLHGRWQPLTKYSKGRHFHTRFAYCKHFPETGVTRPWQPQKNEWCAYASYKCKKKNTPILCRKECRKPKYCILLNLLCPSFPTKELLQRISLRNTFRHLFCICFYIIKMPLSICIRILRGAGCEYPHLRGGCGNPHYYACVCGACAGLNFLRDGSGFCLLRVRCGRGLRNSLCGYCVLRQST